MARIEACKDCTKRYIGCHASCKEYQEFKKLKDLERQRRKSDLEYYSHKNYIFKKSGGQK